MFTILFVFFLFFESPTANTPAQIVKLNTSNDVVPRKEVPFGA